MLFLAKAASVANAFIVEVDSSLLTVLCMFVFDSGVGPLVRNDTTFAESYFLRKAVLRLRIDNIGEEFGFVD